MATTKDRSPTSPVSRKDPTKHRKPNKEGRYYHDGYLEKSQDLKIVGTSMRGKRRANKTEEGERGALKLGTSAI